MHTKKIAVIHGPNMTRLGNRETSIYGNQSFEDLEKYILNEAKQLNISIEFYQSNHEGNLVDYIEALGVNNAVDGIIINPAAYTHTSIAIRDALTACKLPAIEVHLSNIFAREPFRSITYTTGGCVGSITGLGFLGYQYGIKWLDAKLRSPA